MSQDNVPLFQPVTDCLDGFCPISKNKEPDTVNHPPHYAGGNRRFETIDVIEDIVQFAPDAVTGALQWQVLKYISRLWQKGNPKQDASKALWYLKRLIDKMD